MLWLYCFKKLYDLLRSTFYINVSMQNNSLYLQLRLDLLTQTEILSNVRLTCSKLFHRSKLELKDVTPGSNNQIFFISSSD